MIEASFQTATARSLLRFCDALSGPGRFSSLQPDEILSRLRRRVQGEGGPERGVKREVEPCCRRMIASIDVCNNSKPKTETENVEVR
jgi:hypothetical protein